MSEFLSRKCTELRSRWADLRARSQRGVAAVEFALMLPVLLAMLAGIMEFGSIYYVKNNMATVARDVARRMAMGELSIAQAEQEVQDQLVSWGLNLTITITDANPPADLDYEVLGQHGGMLMVSVSGTAVVIE